MAETETQSTPEQYETMRRSVFANSRSVAEFEKIATVGEGTYGKCQQNLENIEN